MVVFSLGDNFVEESQRTAVLHTSYRTLAEAFGNCLLYIRYITVVCTEIVIGNRNINISVRTAVFSQHRFKRRNLLTAELRKRRFLCNFTLSCGLAVYSPARTCNYYRFAYVKVIVQMLALCRIEIERILIDNHFLCLVTDYADKLKHCQKLSCLFHAFFIGPYLIIAEIISPVSLYRQIAYQRLYPHFPVEQYAAFTAYLIFLYGVQRFKQLCKRCDIIRNVLSYVLLCV